MLRTLARSLPTAILVLASGTLLLLIATLLDNFNLHRIQWYIGETGLVLLALGTLTGLLACIARLVPGTDTDD